MSSSTINKSCFQFKPLESLSTVVAGQGRQLENKVLSNKMVSINNRLNKTPENSESKLNSHRNRFNDNLVFSLFLFVVSLCLIKSRSVL